MGKVEEMVKEKVKLPEWEACEAAIDEKRATALEEFIYEYEPGDSSDIQWRERLQRLVATTPTTRQRAERAAQRIQSEVLNQRLGLKLHELVINIIAAEFDKAID